MIKLKKIVLRILSFILDLGLASLLIYAITMFSFINPNIDELNRMYKAFYKEDAKFKNLSTKIDEYFKDEILSEEENAEILSSFSNYKDCFKDIKVGEKVTTGDINKLKENISTSNMDFMNERIIEINKLKYMDTVVSLIIYILYFGVLAYILNGQTPFKRLFRIKVVDKDNPQKRISLIKYIIRAILISEILISLTDLILIFSLSKDLYINAHYWITQIKYIYEMSFLVCMVIRDDSRSFHDLMLNTRVLRYDKNGHEIIEQLFSDENEENINKTN